MKIKIKKKYTKEGKIRVKVRRRDGVVQTYWINPKDYQDFINRQREQGNEVVGGMQGVGEGNVGQRKLGIGGEGVGGVVIDEICEYLFSEEGMKKMAEIIYMALEGDDFDFDESDIYEFIVKYEEALKRAICVRGVARLWYEILRDTAERLGILNKGEMKKYDVEKDLGEIDVIRL